MLHFISKMTLETIGRIQAVGSVAISHLTTFATTIRQFLEPHWLESHQGWGEVPDLLSQYMCRYTSIFLATLLREQHGQDVWKIVGGRPPQSPTETDRVGMLASDSTWNDHCWVEGLGLIVDITADQFGHAPVIVTPVSDPRYRANLTEADLAPAFQKLQHRPIRWLAAWSQEKATAGSTLHLT